MGCSREPTLFEWSALVAPVALWLLIFFNMTLDPLRASLCVENFVSQLTIRRFWEAIMSSALHTSSGNLNVALLECSTSMPINGYGTYASCSSSVQFAHKSEKGTLVSERKTTGLVLHAGAQTLV